MQYTINELRQDTFKNVYAVYEVFQNYFGEENTDLQHLPSDDDIAEVLDNKGVLMREDGSCYEANGNKFNSVKSILAVWKPFILVYWPQVKVTNENNKSIMIQDLYAKIELDYKGNIPTENRGFLLNRSTYPMEQWVSNYLHSHICGIPKNRPSAFQQPCLGSGPINATIASLKSDLSEGFDEIKWMLFCEELSRYVTVESLKGIPYEHLEEVNISRNLSDFSGFDEDKSKYEHSLSRFREVFPMDNLREFILYYLDEGHLAIDYKQGSFICGMSYFDYIIDISNAFIEWFNKTFVNNEGAKSIASSCFRHQVLYNAVVAGRKFYDPSGQRTVPDISRYVGQKVCDFKGQEITLKILSSTTQEPQKTIILNHGLAMYILNNILKIINYRYTNEYSRQHWQGNNSSTTAISTPIGERVFYL